MKVRNLEGYKGNNVVNQFVITDGDNVYFQSYSSLIAKKENGKITLGCDWDYSRTTMKYLSKWLYDYCGIDMNKRDIEKAIKSGKFNYDEDMV